MPYPGSAVSLARMRLTRDRMGRKSVYVQVMTPTPNDLGQSESWADQSGPHFGHSSVVKAGESPEALRDVESVLYRWVLPHDLVITARHRLRVAGGKSYEVMAIERPALVDAAALVVYAAEVP